MIILAWIISILVVIIGLLWVFGKALFLIAGFNTASKEEKGNINSRRLGIVCGTCMILFGIQLCVFCFYEYNLPSALGWIVPWGILGIIGIMFVLTNTICKK